MTLPSPRRPGRHFIPRAFAVLACTLMVASLALATLVPSEMNLLQALHELDPALVGQMQHAVTSLAGSWIWTAIATPLLMRPPWMVPVCLGVICIGAAISAAAPPSRRTTHRRS